MNWVPPAKSKYWFIVFKGADGRVLCGYFTVDFLQDSDHLLGAQVFQAEAKPVPAAFKENSDYLYEV